MITILQPVKYFPVGGLQPYPQTIYLNILQENKNMVENIKDVDIVENLRKDNRIKGYITGFFDAEGCTQIHSENGYVLETFITQSYTY